MASASASGHCNAELLYLIQRYLTLGPCKKTAEALKAELEENQLIPARTDVCGVSHRRSFAEFNELIGPLVPSDALGRICDRIRPLIDTALPPRISNLKPSLLSTDSQSLFRNEQSAQLRQKRSISQRCVSRFHGKAPLLPRVTNSHVLLDGRGFSGPIGRRRFVNDQLLSRMDRHCRILGHLSSVFCVTFDRSGEFVFTGADDNLIKVWSVHDGRLRFTFRGSAGEITDISISHENTLLAAGSVDKAVRIWCLRTGALLNVFHSHSAQVTALHFLPYMHEDERFLVSTSNDCSVCFYQWNAVNNEFHERPTKFHERETVGAQMITCCYSPGGCFVATGCTDHYVRVYKITRDHNDRIVRILETPAHSDQGSHWSGKSVKSGKCQEIKKWSGKSGKSQEI